MGEGRGKLMRRVEEAGGRNGHSRGKKHCISKKQAGGMRRGKPKQPLIAILSPLIAILSAVTSNQGDRIAINAIAGNA